MATIINDFLRKHQEKCIKEVEQMKQHPYSLEQMKAQVEKIHAESQRCKRKAKEDKLTKEKNSQDD